MFCMYQYSFFFLAEKYSIVWIYHSLFIHSPIGEHVSLFQFLAIMNKASVNIGADLGQYHFNFQFSWINTQEWKF